VRQLSPDLSQADVVNGLSLAYCRVQSRESAFDKPQGRGRLNRFSLLLYGELASGGHG